MNGEQADRAVRVSTLELFFNLVFVFTLTQFTGLLADEPNATGLAKVVLLFSAEATSQYLSTTSCEAHRLRKFRRGEGPRRLFSLGGIPGWVGSDVIATASAKKGRSTRAHL